MGGSCYCAGSAEHPQICIELYAIKAHHLKFGCAVVTLPAATRFEMVRNIFGWTYVRTSLFALRSSSSTQGVVAQISRKVI